MMQPISTAPMDGTTILLFAIDPDEEYDAYIAPCGVVAHRSSQGWFVNGLPLEAGIGDGLLRDADFPGLTPTHWATMPALPAPSEKTEQSE